MRQLTACFSAAAFALAASAVAGPARAADDLGSNPVTELFDSLGVGHKEKPDIDYQERAPLVPPSQTATLPPPQAPGASKGGDWPHDPDVQRRAEREARENLPTTETYSYCMGERGSRLDPDEIGGKRTRGASVPRTAADSTTGDNEISRSSPQELTSQRLNKQAMNPPLAPGSRGKLSDPPPGYLEGNGVSAQAAPAEDKGFFAKLLGR